MYLDARLLGIAKLSTKLIERDGQMLTSLARVSTESVSSIVQI